MFTRVAAALLIVAIDLSAVMRMVDRARIALNPPTRSITSSSRTPIRSSAR
ncbi:MAG TPA: hypothetical protein VIY53_11070 [Acidobacteriaceae bacterium]